MPLLLIAALIVAFLAVVFALQNSAPIEVSLGIWDFEASLAIILLLTLAIGFFIGLCVALPALIRRNLRISRQKKQIDQLQSELVEVRTASPGNFPATSAPAYERTASQPQALEQGDATSPDATDLPGGGTSESRHYP
ncbi:MAG: lipopolysaccharide assembly LapA domain-containing protein [Elainellaceae cyanobacterium]